MVSAGALTIFSGRIILSFAFVALCGALQTHFSRVGFRTNSLSQSLTALPAPSKREPLAWRYSFQLNCKVCGRARSPLGGAVAQRLRGYGWRSEKSVKAIAPTGAALAFLCFDFFFRIVKGEQPLARCGVGRVQRSGGGSRNTPPCLWPSGASLHACGKQIPLPAAPRFRRKRRCNCCFSPRPHL